MKPEPMPQHPHKWLLNKLRAILSNEQYTTLLAAHDRVKARYDTEAKLRAERTALKTLQRAYQYCRPDCVGDYAMRIQHKEARIKRLEQELETYADM